jgi:hypothetical protein
LFSKQVQADAIASLAMVKIFWLEYRLGKCRKIVDDGWVVEMKIPYSVLPFANREKSSLGHTILNLQNY